jgi:hypothetical protein
VKGNETGLAVDHPNCPGTFFAILFSPTDPLQPPGIHEHARGISEIETAALKRQSALDYVPFE